MGLESWSWAFCCEENQMTNSWNSISRARSDSVSYEPVKTRMSETQAEAEELANQSILSCRLSSLPSRPNGGERWEEAVFFEARKRRCLFPKPSRSTSSLLYIHLLPSKRSILWTGGDVYSSTSASMDRRGPSLIHLLEQISDFRLGRGKAPEIIVRGYLRWHQKQKNVVFMDRVNP